jgi:hypothetical protein
MAICYVCKNELTEENASSEHILLNCSGAKLRSKELLCITHNSKFGEKIDSELSLQIGLVANLLNVKRDRGTAPAFRAKSKSGTVYDILAGGKPALSKPEFIQEKEGDKVEITIKARSMNEAKIMLEGLKRKYSSIDINKELEAAQRQKDVLLEPVEVQTKIGGNFAFKSILKSAIGFYLYSGGEILNIQNVISDIDPNNLRPVPVGLFYDGNTLVSAKDIDIFHVVAVKGAPAMGKLIAYVEYFRCYRFLVLLNANYNGPVFESSYIYNPISGIEISNISFNWGNGYQMIEGVLETKNASQACIKRVLDKFSPIFLKEMDDKYFEEKYQEIQIEFENKYEGEEFFTEEMQGFLVQRITEVLMPFVLRGKQDL